MGLVKSITRSEPVRKALCWTVAQYIRLVRVTGRWTYVGGEHAAAMWGADKPFILCFWHGRIFMMPYIWRRPIPFKMLASQHRDGQLIATTVAHLGIGSITGSSSKGGAAALRGILKSLKQGVSVGFTPDGPRGPRMRCSAGVIMAAKLSGVPILPATVAAKKRRILSTWDHFAVALPFTKGLYIWGEPLSVPRDADEAMVETLRLELENRLNALTREADVKMGNEPIEPAPVPPQSLLQVAEGDRG